MKKTIISAAVLLTLTAAATFAIPAKAFENIFASPGVGLFGFLSAQPQTADDEIADDKKGGNQADISESQQFSQGFEINNNNWNITAGTRTASQVGTGSNTVASRTGSSHGEVPFQNGSPGASFTDWGIYNSTFPALGYTTEVAVYLNVAAGHANDSRFDFSSAINNSSGGFLSDFVFNAGFYDASDLTGPGAGTNRFVVSAGNNATRSSSFPKNPDHNPTAIQVTGWYLFKHKFVNNGSGVLSVEMSIIDSSNAVVFTRTVSNPLHLISSTGGNRYGWFVRNEFPFLAIDDSRRSNLIPDNPTDFEDFNVGSPNGQEGFTCTGCAPNSPGYDHAIVNNTSAPVSFGSKSLRISNAVTSGSFDFTYSSSTPNEAGETTAENGGMSGGTRRQRFITDFDFISTTPTALQPGLSFSASPDRGDGARMSFVRLFDTPGGINVEFVDYPTGAAFVTTVVATGLDRSIVHNIRLEMIFVDGPMNDVVEVYIDDVLVHTGTSWEEFFRLNQGPNTRTVDSVLFQNRSGAGTATASLGQGFLIDNVFIDSPNAPTVVSINRANPSPTNAATVDFLVTFSENVDGVDATDFVLAATGLSGASISGVSGTGSTRTVTVNTGSGTGTLGLNLVDDDTIVDLDTVPQPLDGVGGGVFVGQVYAVDTVAPMVVSINRTNPPGPSTNATTLVYTVTFSEAVTGVDQNDFALTTTGIVNGASISSISGGGTTYTVTITLGGGSNGTLRLDVRNDATILDTVGNPLTGGFTAGQVYTLDTTRPSVTINQAAAQPDPTSAQPINFTVVFADTVPIGSVTVVDFDDAADVTLAGSAGGVLTATKVITQIDATTFNVAVSGLTSSGTVTATIAENVATDAAGNGNTASTSTDNTVTFAQEDLYAITAVSPQNLVRFSSSSPGTIASTVAINGLQTGETLLGIDFRPSNRFLYGLGSSSRIYTINTVTGMAIPIGPAGAFTLSGTEFGFDFNPAANMNLGLIRIVSNTGQNLRINPDTGALAGTDTPLNPATTGVAAAAYTNNDTDPVTGTTLYDIDADNDTLFIQNLPNNGTLVSVGPLGVDVGEVNGFDISGVSTAAYAALSDDPNTAPSALYTINLTTGSASLVGAIGSTLTIRGLTATPIGGVNNPLATVTINQAVGQDDPTNELPINFTVVFSEPVTGFGAESTDVNLSGCLGATATVTGGPTSYNVAVSGITDANCTLTATVPPGAATDVFGNGSAPSTSTDNMVTYALPSVLINSASANEGSNVVFTVSLSSAVSADVTVNFTVADGTGPNGATNPADYGTSTPVSQLIIEAGDTTGTISVPTVFDIVEESNETFDVTLNSVTNAVLGSPTVGTGTITDVDTTPVYVNDNFANPVPGQDPDGAGPATNFGFDSFPTVQGGVNGVTAGGTVFVYNGLYTEQVVISKSLTMDGGEPDGGTITQTTIKMPPTAGATVNPLGDVTIVDINNGATVNMQDLTVTGTFNYTGCVEPNPYFDGIFVYDSATLNLSNAAVTDIRQNDLALFGCQNGFALSVGLGTSLGTATVTNVTFSGYQKEAIFVNGDDGTNNSSVTVTGSTFIGQGPVNTAQNIFEISGGADASIGDGTPAGANQIGTAAGGSQCNITSPACGPDGFQGSGVLLFNAGVVTINRNSFMNNDTGILAGGSNGLLTITNNTLTGNRYFGMILGEGTTVATGNTLSTPMLVGVSMEANNAVTFTKNTILGATTGVQLRDDSPQALAAMDVSGSQIIRGRLIKGSDENTANGVVTPTPTPMPDLIVANYNRIISTMTAIDNPDNTTANLQFNWWGCNAGPGGTGCGAVVGTGADFDPWVILSASATPNSIIPGATSNVSSNLANDSTSTTMTPAPLADFIPDTPVAFTAINGTMSPTGGTITTNLPTGSLFTSTNGSNATATVTVDNEVINLPITVNAPQFSINDISIVEGESGTSLLTFTITKTGASMLPSSVNYATVDGTATDANNDYEPANGTLNFPATATTDTQTVSVTINGDIVFEGDENFFVNLTVPVNAGISDAQGIGTILEDGIQPSVQFSSATYSINETGTAASTTATITVTRTGSPGNVIDVDYATGAGPAPTATGGASCGGLVDYITTSGTLNFAANEVSETFNVSICGDINIESIENLNLTLSNIMGGAVIGTPNPATLSIRDGNISISGTITDPATNGIGGVTVTLTGTGSVTSISTMTAANGTYSFAALRSGANYLVTPTQSGTAFEPLERSYAGVVADVTGADFVGYPAATIPRNLRVVTGSGAVLGTAVVPINLNSTFSNVNGMTFSIDFDQSILVFNSVACGTGAPAGCTVNAAVDPGSGNLAVSLDLPSGVSFVAGDRQALRLTFTNVNTPPSTPSLSTPINFADTPVVREMVGLDGNRVQSTYTDGSLILGNLEGDVSPRTATASGNGVVSGADAAQISRFAAFLDFPHGNTVTNEFQRADTAPLGTNGNGSISGADAAQARRFAAGLDPLQPAAGPMNPAPLAEMLQKEIDEDVNSIFGGTTISVANITGSRNQDVIVNILMDSQGIENSISFTLLYDPAKLRIVNAPPTPPSGTDVMLGTGAVDGNGGTPALTVNRLRDGGGNDIGRVGVIVGFGAGQSMAAGSGRQLLRVRFRVLITATPGFTPIEFVGAPPVILETTDVDINDVPTSYGTGNGVNILPPTSAGVSVEGRVMSSAGTVFPYGSIVTITDQETGQFTRVRTSSFGVYRFDGVASGRTYILQASAKGYTFMPMTISLTDDISGLDITVEP